MGVDPPPTTTVFEGVGSVDDGPEGSNKPVRVVAVNTDVSRLFGPRG